MPAALFAALTVSLTSFAVYTDVRWGKIFNRVTLPAIALGLALNAALSGVDGLVWSLEGVGVGLGLFLASAFFGRLLGGGDIKLFMAIGALQGPSFLGWAVVYTVLVGAALAIAVGLYRGVLGQRLRLLMASSYLRLAQGVPMEMTEAEAGPRLPYAIAICLGSLIALAVFNAW